ncbi:MAG: hypothetical protein D6788_05940 [Planctomycetota bacterium]|nr:MAG: hypothetical protein D6788_05940 [Planctomycetota bacterium]
MAHVRRNRDGSAFVQRKGAWLSTARAVTVCVLVALAGCLEVQQLLTGTTRPPGGGAPPTDNADGGGSGDAGAGGGDVITPQVVLDVSNPAPQLNEELQLVCRVVNNAGGMIRFEFQPDDGRLVVDHEAGTAVLVIEPSDIGQTFDFTCTASNEAGTSNPSNVQTVAPT